MTAATVPAAVPDAARDRMHAAYVAALLLAEAILLIVLVKLLTPLLIPDAAAAETLSVWAIGGALALGFAAARLLGSRELSNRQRIFWGLAITFVALQIIGRADLSESARVWDMSWLIDLGSPSSDVWRQAGALDELIAGLMLIPIWFRGVALGSDDLDERPFTRTVLLGFAVLVVGFILADNAGVESIVQISAIVWALVCVVAVALKNASRADDDPAGRRHPDRADAHGDSGRRHRGDRHRAPARRRHRRRRGRLRRRRARARRAGLRPRIHRQGHRLPALPDLLDPARDPGGRPPGRCRADRSPQRGLRAPPRRPGSARSRTGPHARYRARARLRRHRRRLPLPAARLAVLSPLPAPPPPT